MKDVLLHALVSFASYFMLLCKYVIFLQSNW